MRCPSNHAIMYFGRNLARFTQNFNLFLLLVQQTTHTHTLSIFNFSIYPLYRALNNCKHPIAHLCNRFVITIDWFTRDRRFPQGGESLQWLQFWYWAWIVKSNPLVFSSVYSLNYLQQFESQKSIYSTPVDHVCTRCYLWTTYVGNLISKVWR